MPEPPAVLVREFEIRSEDRESVSFSPAYELSAPFSHLVATPTLYAAVIKAERRVGNYKFFVNSDYVSKPLTVGTQSHGGVEGKEVVSDFLKRDAVGFEPCREIVYDV